jgi:uncharacterized protein (TIGR02996 family)
MSRLLGSEEAKAFIRKIVTSPGDIAPRLVYADWLDEQDTEYSSYAAEFLRLLAELSQTDPEALRFTEVKLRLRKLEKHLPRTWLAVLDVPLIEACAQRFQFACPAEWERLRITEDTHIRLCDECKREVHFCHNLYDAANAASAGKCIALSTTLLRKQDDLVEAIVQRSAVMVGKPRLT